MGVLLALSFVLAIIVYARLDYYFAHAEEAADKAFSDAMKRCDQSRLTQKEKDAYDTLVRFYESKYVGLMFVLVLLSDFPQQIAAIFSKGKRRKTNIKNQELIEAIHYWSKSHVYRNTIAAISCYVLLSAHSLLMALRLEERADKVFDGHAEDAVLLRASRQLKKGHYLEKLAA